MNWLFTQIWLYVLIPQQIQLPAFLLPGSVFSQYCHQEEMEEGGGTQTIRMFFHKRSNNRTTFTFSQLIKIH